MEEAAADPPVFAVKDAGVHRRLSQTTHSPLRIGLLDSMQGLLAAVRETVGKHAVVVDRVSPTHRRIMECVATRDADGAREAMRKHLAIALEIQKEVIARQAAKTLGTV